MTAATLATATSAPGARLFEALFEDQSAKARAARGQPIAIRGLKKRFGELEVLRGIDLDVPAGQFLAIVGRSGCGKSTLLRILAGLDTPSEGTLSLNQAGTAAATPRIMFQEPRLLPWARVLSNVEVGLGAERKLPKAEERAFQTLRAVGLEAKAQQWPALLSGGQRQRVALARALVSRPRVLALDEPLGALDALTRIEMQGLLERVWLAQGFTAILVTHDVSEALTLADRVVMIDEGRITLDIAVDLPRPRRRGSVDLALLEERILKDLIREDANPPEYAI
jgi:sulfonate transport system ATP-binding protein